jgi:hypothetical protein
MRNINQIYQHMISGVVATLGRTNPLQTMAESSAFAPLTFCTNFDVSVTQHDFLASTKTETQLANLLFSDYEYVM